MTFLSGKVFVTSAYQYETNFDRDLTLIFAEVHWTLVNAVQYQPEDVNAVEYKREDVNAVQYKPEDGADKDVEGLVG